MATLISKASGNFTTNTTWGLVDSASLSDSEAASTAGTTSYVYSATFTPGAITVDGIAVKIASRTASPSGTMTMELYNHTDSASVASVTINATDIINFQSQNGGWYFFKFASSHTLIAAKAYKIGFTTSSSGTVSLYRNATAGNWSRMLRTTTHQSPASGDALHVMGEWTAAATQTALTVTNDNTATTSFGSTTLPQSITVSNGGTLTYGTSSSTNYYLKYKGIFGVFAGGTLNIGTSGARIPSTSSAVLEMDATSNVDTGLVIYQGGSFNAYGNAKTNVATLMTADKSATDTVIALSSTSGWAAGDLLAFASTTRTAAECESKTIATVDSGTQVTLSAGLGNDHSGTAPTQAEVINLTRNVKIRGISASLQGYIHCLAASTTALDSVEFTQLGSNTTSKRGIDIQTTVGSFSASYCATHDSTVAGSAGFYVTGSISNNVTLSYCVSYNLAGLHFGIGATSGTNWTIDHCTGIRATDGAAPIFYLLDVGGTFTHNTAVGTAYYACYLQEANGVVGTFSDFTGHSSANAVIAISASLRDSVFSNLTLWRANLSGGLLFTAACCNLTFNNITAFGNGAANISVVNVGISNVAFDTLVCSGDSTFSTPSGMNFTASMGNSITLTNGDFGTAAGIKTAHTTGDININSMPSSAQIMLHNCVLASTTEISSQSNLASGSWIGSQKHDQTAGNHRSWFPNGNISIDTTIYDTTPSQRLTPGNASGKLESGGLRIAVASGGTLTPSVKVRCSVSGDGAAYNGNRPRLIVKKNVAAGITSDTVLATATGASDGAFETLSGTTASVSDDGVLTFVVDCDGTAGWVNVDSATVA